MGKLHPKSSILKTKKIPTEKQSAPHHLIKYRTRRLLLERATMSNLRETMYILTKRLVLFDLYQRRKNKKKTEFLTSTKKLVLHLHPPNLRGRESHRRTKKVFLRIKTIQLRVVCQKLKNHCQ